MSPLRKFTPRPVLDVEPWIKCFLWVCVGVGFYRCRGLRCSGGSCCWGRSVWPDVASLRPDGPEGRRDTALSGRVSSQAWVDQNLKNKSKPSPGWKAHKARAQYASPHPSSMPHGTFARSSACRAHGAREGKCRRGRQHCGPCLPTRARSFGLAASPLLAGDQLCLRPTSELCFVWRGLRPRATQPAVWALPSALQNGEHTGFCFKDIA